MPSNPATDYIQNARAKGATDDAIKMSLKSGGWTDIQISEAFAPQDTLATPPPPPTGAPQPVKTSSFWDTFEHVLLFISLYVLYTSLALTLHYFVDKYVVTSSGANDYSSVIRSTYMLSFLRGYLAALIVSSPLFSFFHLKVTKRTLAHPEVRNLPARKTLTYLTLVITFIVALINVITIIYNLLSGNVTLNFVLHFIVTIVLTAIIFIYYLNEVNADRKVYA
jgi:hypothetical protein